MHVGPRLRHQIQATQIPIALTHQLSLVPPLSALPCLLLTFCSALPHFPFLSTYLKSAVRALSRPPTDSRHVLLETKQKAVALT